jgi:hypothetical protein
MVLNAEKFSLPLPQWLCSPVKIETRIHAKCRAAKILRLVQP